MAEQCYIDVSLNMLRMNKIMRDHQVVLTAPKSYRHNMANGQYNKLETKNNRIHVSVVGVLYTLWHPVCGS